MDLTLLSLSIKVFEFEFETMEGTNLSEMDLAYRVEGLKNRIKDVVFERLRGPVYMELVRRMRLLNRGPPCQCVHVQKLDIAYAR